MQGLFPGRLSVTLWCVREQIRPFPTLQLVVLTIARLCINTGLRMVYPFLPALSRGLGIELPTAYRLVTVRHVTGFFSPLLGPLSERFGRRPVIVGAVLLFGLGCFVVVAWPMYGALGVTLSLMALGKVTFDPAMQSYLADAVPYRQRGRALAVTELAWSGALLIGAPAIGFAIQTWGWQSPFAWLGALTLLSAWLVWWHLPTISTPHRQHRFATWRDMVGVLRQYPVIWAAVLYVILAMMANEMLFIMYGDWMEASFSLSLSSLGLASGVIGGAEICGEIIAGLSVDKFGKRPVIITTGLLNALAYALIPHAGHSLVGALGMLFWLFFFFEVTFVGTVPLFTELVPTARGVVMSMTLGAAAVGRAMGSWLGPLIWQRAGFVGSGTLSAVLMVTAVFILAYWVREAHSLEEANKWNK